MQSGVAASSASWSATWRADQHLRAVLVRAPALPRARLGDALRTRHRESATAAASRRARPGQARPPSVLVTSTRRACVRHIEGEVAQDAFLERAAAVAGLPLFVPLTLTSGDFALVFFDVDATAKAFEALEQVAPIAAACIRERAAASAVLATSVRLGLAEKFAPGRGRFVACRRIVGSRDTASRTRSARHGRPVGGVAVGRLCVETVAVARRCCQLRRHTCATRRCSVDLDRTVDDVYEGPRREEPDGACHGKKSRDASIRR